MADPEVRSVDAAVPPDEELLVLVDEDDREIGHLGKGACHDGDGVLHRAFSLFIFNRAGELLLQRRSAGKRLWPLYWSNSCCSHPRRGEAMATAISRRLLEELGMTSDLHHVFTFTYHARFGEAGSEREVCWVWAGASDDVPRPNPHEIAEIRWVAPDHLDREMAERPHDFTPWFLMEWERVREGSGVGG
ncbi:MAG TPA: isopentenyl-diphosphate Delta-isomerase [Thermoanaerobaculales bacterium]|nr:isopentenyl-diphosphate Delta-isomerase [Thermoanaerobaculales bacterium]